MTNRPKWAREIINFLGDTIMDEKYGWPNDDSADDITDEIEAAARAILCKNFGHEIEDDQCGIPSHAYCVWCHRGVIDIRHMEHARVCNCLDDAGECCVDSCPCPRVEHGTK